MQVSKLSPVSFNGQYRNVIVRKIANHEYRARVLDSQKDSGRCLFADEAIYRAIVNSNDFKPDSTIKKYSNIAMNRKQREVLTSVYYTDENEKVDIKQVRPRADYIVYASGSDIQE
jgi:hypothetical protein